MFHFILMFLLKAWILLFFLQLWVNRALYFWYDHQSRRRISLNLTSFYSALKLTLFKILPIAEKLVNLYYDVDVSVFCLSKFHGKMESTSTRFFAWILSWSQALTDTMQSWPLKSYAITGGHHIAKYPVSDQTVW